MDGGCFTDYIDDDERQINYSFDSIDSKDSSYH